MYFIDFSHIMRHYRKRIVIIESGQSLSMVIESGQAINFLFQKRNKEQIPLAPAAASSHECRMHARVANSTSEQEVTSPHPSAKGIYSLLFPFVDSLIR